MDFDLLEIQIKRDYKLLDASNSHIIFSRGRRLFVYASNTSTLITRSLKDSIHFSLPVINRVLRLEVLHARICNKYLIVFLPFQILSLCLKTLQIVSSQKLYFKAPLLVVRSSSNPISLLFGEYTSSSSRGLRSSFQLDVQPLSGELMLYKLIDVPCCRHIHSIHPVPNARDLLICTGDMDEDCSIYKLDHRTSKHHSLITLAHGSQLHRCIALSFVDDVNFFYGTDAPCNQNFLVHHSLDKHKSPREILDLPGPVFRIERLAQQLLISIAVEPSSFRLYPFASLLLYDISSHTLTMLDSSRPSQYYNLKYMQYLFHDLIIPPLQESFFLATLRNLHTTKVITNSSSYYFHLNKAFALAQCSI
ncbi:hypothetical protein [Synechococcus sp. KORDI-49]|uniref:hypothetical protein n=1 Tax=Synechococcus sp. KORDI-49 TaxID=585423 RepID=UPI000ACD3E81|nr:hypothetical protein [Synechococcus sp. KORDI-49]